MKNCIEIEGLIYTYEFIKTLTYIQVIDLIAMCDTIDKAKRIANNHSEESIIYVQNLELKL